MRPTAIDSAASSVPRHADARQVRQQQEGDGDREGQQQRQPAQPLGVLAGDAVAHLAHDEVGLRVRRLERAHLAEVAEAGGGLDGVRARLAVDARASRAT